MERFITAIQRKFGNPVITTTVETAVDGGIRIECSLDDFLKMVRENIGGVTFTMTGKAFDAQFNKAVEDALQAMKNETIKVAHMIPPKV